MIKRLSAFVLSILTATTLFAQSEIRENNGPFKHMAIGLSLGSGGIGLDVAATLSDHFQARLGGELMPPMTIGANVRTNKVGYVKLAEQEGLPEENINLNYDMTFDAEPHMSAAHFMVDYYPMYNKSFFISVGAFIGSNKITAVNDSYQDEIKALKDVAEYNQKHPDDKIGIQMGPYLLAPDENGKVNASFDATMKFQPYIGIGFGKSVPKYRMSTNTPYNKRVGYMFEIGARFWGTPSITCNGEKIDNKTLEKTGETKMLRTITSLPFYPVIKFRISGRIF